MHMHIWALEWLLKTNMLGISDLTDVDSSIDKGFVDVHVVYVPPSIL